MPSKETLGLYLDNSPKSLAFLRAALQWEKKLFILHTAFPPRVLQSYLKKASCTTVYTVKKIPGLDVEQVPLPLLPPRNDIAVEDYPCTTYFMTSGSTRAPKVAILPWRCHMESCTGAQENMALTSSSRILLSLPLYHLGGFAQLVRSLVVGCSIHLPLEEDKLLYESIVKKNITHASFVSTQLHRWKENKLLAPPSLQSLLVGGSHIPLDLKEWAYENAIPCQYSYGMTEMASQVCTTSLQGNMEELKSSGHLLPGRELTFAPDGEILLSGPTCFAGYLGEEASKPFHTKDYGYFDKRGNLHLHPRRDQMLISGGENINMAQVEAAFARITEVSHFDLRTMDHKEFGTHIKAFVQTNLKEEQLCEKLAEHLPKYMIPKNFTIYF